MGNDAGQAKALTPSDAEKQSAEKKRPGPPPRPRASGAIKAPTVIETIEAVDAMSVPPSKDGESAAAPSAAVDVVQAKDADSEKASKESVAKASDETVDDDSKQASEASGGEPTSGEAADEAAADASEGEREEDREVAACGEPAGEDAPAASEPPKPANDPVLVGSERPSSRGDSAPAAASEPESGEALVGSAERDEAHASKPDEPAEQENPNGRRFDRFSVDLDVTVTSEHNFYAGFVENMSVGGIFIATHQLKKVGDVLEFSIHLPDHGEAISGQGEVRWVRVYSETSNVPPGMGIRFRNLSESDQKRIEAFLAEREPMFYDDED